MFKNLSIGIRLLVVFLLLLILFSAMSLFIVYSMGSLSDLTENLYNHPMTVSNAVLRIDGNIIRIHRSMKDVVLAKDESDIAMAVHLVDTYETAVYHDFAIIFDRFLGDPRMYQEAEHIFTDWKPIRDEVITLMQEGQKDAAADITKGRGAFHVAKLSQAMMELNNFAQNKAQSFLEDSREVRIKILTVVYTLIIITIIVGIIIILLLNWSITRPLNKLMNNVLQISLGDLDIEKETIAGGEIGKLTNAFYTMAFKLKESYTNLEEKIALRTREVEESKEELLLFGQALDNMIEGVIIVKAENRMILYTNPAFEKMYGYLRKELMGSDINILNPPDNEPANQVTEKISRAVAKKGEWEGEVLNRKKDGTRFYTHAKISKFNHRDEGELIITVQQDITHKKLAEEQIKDSLEEKEALLRELHHRTKNNMQVIISILSLQGMRINNSEVQDMIQGIKNKINAMSLVHQKLYLSKNLSLIDIKEYLNDLLNLLMRAYGLGPENFKVYPEEIQLPVLIDLAIPCGLVVTEAVTNSLKHAFPDRDFGLISLGLRETEDNKLIITISDNGVGVPEDFDFEAQNTLGLQSIYTITQHQLQGKVTFSTGKGVTCTLEIPAVLYKERI